MFFGNSEKDKKIAELEARVSELESKQLNEDKIIEEIEKNLTNFNKGLYDSRISVDSNNTRLSKIKNSINETLLNYQNLENNSVEISKEYENKLSELLDLINSNSNELNTQIQELNANSNALANISNEHVSRIQETSTSLDRVTSTIVSNGENSSKMASYASEVVKSAKIGQDMANETDKAMDDINAQVTSINEAITIIDEIAFQTNILSLNAAVEAATAGEAGKGFAVVAGEVRNLANRSAQAAKEIKALVEIANNKTQNGKDVAYKMTQGYERLYDNINNTIALIKEVSNASQEQKQAIEEINSIITRHEQENQDSAHKIRQIDSQSELICELSFKLVEIVSNTKIETLQK